MSSLRKRGSDSPSEEVRGAPAQAQTQVVEAAHLAGDARKVAGVAVGVGSELLKLVREMLVIPAQIWLAIAEVAGAAVLFAWRRIVLPGLGAVLASPEPPTASGCVMSRRRARSRPSVWSRSSARRIAVGRLPHDQRRHRRLLGRSSRGRPGPRGQSPTGRRRSFVGVRAARGCRARRVGAGAHGSAAGGEAADCGRGRRDRDQRRGGRAEGARRGQRGAHLRGRRGAPARGLLAPDRGWCGADRGRPAPAPLSATGTGGIERRDDRGPRPRARAPAAHSRGRQARTRSDRGPGERPVDGEGSVSGAST